ncbi:MAG: thioredoxin domain-containing protein [Acidobacteriota bacterium]|nr:thioredoxin domain-containing protein [Acidobacteriota bacterium]
MRTAELPSVDLNGLTAVQKQAALKIVREHGCTCGCSMKIAQCRVEDPKCSTSKALSAKVIRGIREGKNAEEIVKGLSVGAGPAPMLDDPVRLVTEGAPVKGPENARVTLVEFSDFQCPYCSQAVLELEALQKAFPKDVKLIYKQFPLSEIHSHAVLAAQGALAAHAQGKFWALHDRMFQNHDKLSRENILKWAREAGCDMAKFTADMDSAKTKEQISRDLKQGEEAGVEGTPTIFVNGKHYNGSLALQPFSVVVRSELKGK